jgi:hypothetical protein
MCTRTMQLSARISASWSQVRLVVMSVFSAVGSGTGSVYTVKHYS